MSADPAASLVRAIERLRTSELSLQWKAESGGIQLLGHWLCRKCNRWAFNHHGCKSCGRRCPA